MAATNESVKVQGSWDLVDLEYRRSDGVVIEGSPGHWFPTNEHGSLYESETRSEAMALADSHWPV